MEAGTPHTAESEWDNRQGPWVNGDWSEGSPSWENRGRGCQSRLQSSHGSTTQHSWDFVESDAPPRSELLCDQASTLSYECLGIVGASLEDFRRGWTNQTIVVAEKDIKNKLSLLQHKLTRLSTLLEALRCEQGLGDAHESEHGWGRQQQTYYVPPPHLDPILASGYASAASSSGPRPPRQVSAVADVAEPTRTAAAADAASASLRAAVAADAAGGVTTSGDFAASSAGLAPARPGVSVLPPPGLAAPVQKMFDVAFFLSRKDFLHEWPTHNGALKYFRDTHERADDPFMSEPVLFSNIEPARIAEVVHAKGTSYSFNTDNMLEWRWQDMVAQLVDEDVRLVVEGRDGRGRGLVSCECAPRGNSYDHKRQAAMRAAGKKEVPKLPIWDFVLRRADGTGVRLHPQWTCKGVETSELEGPASPTEPPKNGLGKSDGRGTFRKYVSIAAAGHFKFDFKKVPAKMQGASVAKSKGGAPQRASVG